MFHHAKNNKYIITGAPGTGKTSIINELLKRGYCCIKENSREIIENNLTGWLVNPGEPELLGEKIIDVLNLEQKKKDLIGSNARKRIIEKFNLKQMLDKTINVYEELIEAKKNFGN